MSEEERQIRWHGLNDGTIGRGTRKPEIRRLLAVLAARQRLLPTVQAVQAGYQGAEGLSPTDRMLRRLAVAHGRDENVNGAFNPRAAGLLSGGDIK